MVLDYLKNLPQYEGCNKYLAKITEFVSKNDLKTLTKGKYDLGDECFVNIQEPTLTTSDRWEAHVKYLDVQYIISGSETILWNDFSAMQDKTEYDEVKDRYLGTGEGQAITVEEGQFMLLFPNDAHCPAIKAHHDNIKKAVFKIKVQ